MCRPGEVGGALQWARSAAELPGFMPGLAGARDGAAVVAGRTAVGDDGDAFVELRDAEGAAVWSDSYAGANGLQDGAVDVAIDASGFVHVLVEETILAVEGEMMGTYDARLVVLRFAPDGAHVWRWELARPPAQPWTSYSPMGQLATDGATIFVLAGSYEEPFKHVRLDTAGNVLGEAILAPPDNADYKVRHDLGADGSVVLAARTESPEGLWIARFDDHGAPSWEHALEGDPTEPRAVLVGEAGAAYLLETPDAKPSPLSLRKFAGDGAVAWTMPLPDASAESLRFGDGLRQDGALLLVGGVEKPPQPGNEWGQRKDLWVGLMAADGALLWSFEHEFGLPYSWGDANTAAFTSDGAVIVSGAFLGEDGGTQQPWLGRLCGG